jgi:hypothetical protein
MTDAHYFGDDTPGLGDDVGDVHGLARRQFIFSLTVGALLLASAALIGAHSFSADRSPLALHHAKHVAPAEFSAPSQAIALPGVVSAPEG